MKEDCITILHRIKTAYPHLQVGYIIASAIAAYPNPCFLNDADLCKALLKLEDELNSGRNINSM